jgi:hypothetical protein
MTTVTDADRRIRSWLTDGPNSATPADALIAVIMERVHGTSPRPLMYVVATRPSSVMGTRHPPRQRRLTWVVAAAIASLLAVIGTLAAGGIRSDPLPTERPLDRPSPTSGLESRPPATSPPPTPQPAVAPFKPHLVSLPLLGVRLWIHDEGTRDPITFTDKPTADLYVPMAFFGAQRVSLVAGHAAERKATIPLGPDSARIDCGTLDAMADAIAAAFLMQDATRSFVQVDGITGIRLRDAVDDRVRNVVALVTPTGCLFVSSDGIPSQNQIAGEVFAYDGGDAIMTQVLEDILIDRPAPTPAATPPAVTRTDLGFTVTGPRIGWSGTMYGGGTGPGWTFGFGQCTVDLCSRIVVIHAARLGEPLWKLDPLDELSLDLLRRSVESAIEYAPAPTRIRLDGVQAWRWDGWVMTVIAVHDGRAYVIQALPGFMGDASLSDLDFVLDGWSWDDR